MNNCWCYECNKDVKLDSELGLTIPMVKMILCPICENKRCPHATDHRLGCSDSNDPGQDGSRYGVYPHSLKKLLDFVDRKNDSID